MMINKLEKFIVNSPLRAAIQRRYEIPLLLSFAQLPQNAQILEVGCGRGIGLETLKKRSKVAGISGCDIDAEMIEKAKSRIGSDANLWVGSATNLAAPNRFYDAVFVFGVLHHIKNWQAAIREIKRVLKPGGIIYLIEYYKPLICHPIVKTFLDHPQTNRFDHAELLSALKFDEFQIVKHKNVQNWYGFIAARKH